MKEYLPLAARQTIARLRDLRCAADIFGRFAVGGLQAHVGAGVRARMWRHISIGRNAQIHRGTLLHTNDSGIEPRIVIGERSFIGQNCFFSAGEMIHLEQDCLIGANCNILGAGHVYEDPSRSYPTSPVVSYGSIVLEANCWIGTACTIVGGVRIGFGSIVACASLVRESVPPLCMVAGSPAKLRKTFDWSTGAWKAVPESGEALEDALEHHLKTLPTHAGFVERLSRMQ